MTSFITRNLRFVGQVDRILAKTATAVAAATGAGLIGQSQEAQAQIIYSGIVNLNVPSTTAGIYLNVVTGANGITPASAPGWDLSPWGTTGFNIWANNPASPADGVVAGLGSSPALVDNLPLNTFIDGTQTFVRTNGIETTGSTAFALNGVGNYVGFRFLNEVTGLTNFGWARFSFSSTFQGQPRTLVDYAYEASGAGIFLPLPEPTSLALLSLGAIGLGIYRRHRNRAAVTV